MKLRAFTLHASTSLELLLVLMLSESLYSLNVLLSVMQSAKIPLYNHSILAADKVAGSFTTL